MVIASLEFFHRMMVPCVSDFLRDGEFNEKDLVIDGTTLVVPFRQSLRWIERRRWKLGVFSSRANDRRACTLSIYATRELFVERGHPNEPFEHSIAGLEYHDENMIFELQTYEGVSIRVSVERPEGRIVISD